MGGRTDGREYGPMLAQLEYGGVPKDQLSPQNRVASGILRANSANARTVLGNSLGGRFPLFDCGRVE
jgi:hypothetical protein